MSAISSTVTACGEEGSGSPQDGSETSLNEEGEPP